MATTGVHAPAADMSADKTWVRRVSALSTGLVVAVICFCLFQVMLAVLASLPFIDLALSENVRPMQPATALLLAALGTAAFL
ncbi:MAG: hypothetical protein ACRDVD_06270, partial [Acidimicrobiia bacterium]